MIREAMPTHQDPEGFWQVGRPVSRTQIDLLNERVRAGKAEVIQPNAPFNDGWLITFGGGFHYQVECVHQCANCGSKVYTDETDPDLYCCHSCSGEVAEQAWFDI